MGSDTNARQRLRLVLGFLVAPALPVAAFALPALLAGQWRSALAIGVIGGVIAAVMVLAVVVPLYLWLRRRRRLRLYWAAVAGGAAGAAFPLVSAVSWVLLVAGSRSGYSAGGIPYFEDGMLTWEGALILFVAYPVGYFLIGALCGLVGWLIAFGPRVTPRDDK